MRAGVYTEVQSSLMTQQFGNTGIRQDLTEIWNSRRPYLLSIDTGQLLRSREWAFSFKTMSLQALEPEISLALQFTVLVPIVTRSYTPFW